MRADDIRAENFDILKFRYFDNTPARKAKERISRYYGTKKLARELRSHHVEGVQGSEILRRDDVDTLLEFYALVETATICGYVPENLPAGFAEEAIAVLREPSVERYYARFYPVLLAQLFAARVERQFAVQADVTADASRAFIRFLDISQLLEIEEVEDFLWFLEDGEIDGEDLDDMIEKIQTPQSLGQALAASPEKRSPSDSAVQGFRGFTAFARQFDALLQSVAMLPVVQSAFWHYHGYWLQLLSGTVLGVMSTAIEQQRMWVALDPIKTDEDAGRARRTHASMDTTQLVLQRLTSGIYRAELERFYFDCAIGSAMHRETAAAPQPVNAALTKPLKVRPPVKLRHKR